ncbi:expressed unknown protein [Seminavis robusta]|uniref:C2H2-type domain-containing protein n=1 Tax=Seminavis robusta TaxID=568900 RepID=A0A9N8F3U1_9STRA|nr:expressed unknown protein [Seminavis robusta]|eukprot:Sro2721_g335530.1 n/a (166) ;mRNA; r:11239-11736
MTLYQCDCGFGRTSGATGTSITHHLKGKHSYEVNAASSGNFFCNACTKGSYGSGKRFASFEDLLEHLEDKHCCDCISKSDCWDYTTGLYKCGECSFGSSTGAVAENIVYHIKGNHNVDVGISSSGYFYCNDCGSFSRGRKFDSCDDLMEHLENHHGLEKPRQFLG